METSPHDALSCIWREAWKPPDRRPPWRWLEEHILSIPYSPIPGRFRSENSPWMREPLEEWLTNPLAKVISIVACIQAGKTSIAEFGSCWIAANAPGPTLWLDQTDDDAKDETESRLHPLWSECPPVRSLFSDNRHKKKLDVTHFVNGMSLWTLGAHNKTNLQRRSIRWLIGDETWRWPVGHRAEALARTTAFGWLGKALFTSQAGEDGGETHLGWLEGSQGEWSFTCPHCSTVQPWEFKQLSYDETAQTSKGWDYGKVRRSVRLVCSNESCGHEFHDNSATRATLNNAGEFIHARPEIIDQKSYHWNSLCSGSWGFLVELFLKAREVAKKGDVSLLKIFYQKRLALPWLDEYLDFSAVIPPSSYSLNDEERWSGEGGISTKGTIIAGPFSEGNFPRIPLRFLTVDVQLDHVWVLSRSWSANGSSRLIRWRKMLTWDDVEAEQEALGISSSLVFVDAGNDSYNVYRECGKRGWTALRGDKKTTFTHRVRHPKTRKLTKRERYYSTARVVNTGTGKTCVVHYWSNLSIKDSLDTLRSNQDPSKGATWEIPADAGDEYLRQMDSERRVIAKGKPIWIQIGKRGNHLWDCEAMQTAAATMLKLIGRESVSNSDKEDEDDNES